MDLCLEHEYEKRDATCAICGALLTREEFEAGEICEKCEEEEEQLKGFICPSRQMEKAQDF